jgi:uncharacterized membrane protein
MVEKKDEAKSKTPAAKEPVVTPAPTPAAATAFPVAGATTTVPTKTGGLAIAALVVGILAFISGWAPIWGLIVGAGAVVLGILALKKKDNKAFGIVGIVGGGLGALTSIIFTLIWILALVAVGTGSAVVNKDISDANKALSSQDASANAQINAKKDFAKGTTATFGDFQVKVNSVNTNYTASDGYSTPSDGDKFVAINATVTNTGSDSTYFGSYDLQLNADGLAVTPSYVTDDPTFTGGNLSAGASTTGNLVFEVKTTASVLKVEYDTTVYTYAPSYQAKKLVYTLAI